MGADHTDGIAAGAKPTKRAIRFLLFAVALLIAVILVRAMLLRERAIDVETTFAGIGPVEDVVVNSEAGTVKARSRARLGVETIGRVAEIPHREGSTVKAGDLLLRLESTTERVRLEAARRNAEVQRATLSGARSGAEEWVGLAATFAVGVVAAGIGLSLAGRLPRGGHATAPAHARPVEAPELAGEPGIAGVGPVSRSEPTR